MPCGLLAVLRRQMPLDQRPHVGARRERRDAVDHEWTGQRSGTSGRNQKNWVKVPQKKPQVDECLGCTVVASLRAGS
jgi:hypothetical protein